MNRAFLLAALAVAALTFSAEARPVNSKGGFDNQKSHSDNGIGRVVNIPIDAAAIPPYPTAETAHARPAGRGLRSRTDLRSHRRARGGRNASPRPSNGFSTVRTAGGLEITGSPGFIGKADSVVRDLASAGYQPKRVTCLSYAKSHVHRSRHFLGKACDVDQHGWGWTSAPKLVLRMIVARHGLRDGCEFRDSGHFDDGPRLDFRRVLRNCGAAYAQIVLPKVFAALAKIKAAAR